MLNCRVLGFWFLWVGGMLFGQTTPENLFKNTTLESGSGNFKPWRFWTKDNAKWLPGMVLENGRPFFKVASSTPITGTLTQTIPVAAGSNYHFSAKYKIVKAGGKTEFYVKLVDKNFKEIKWLSFPVPAKEGEWQSFSRSLVFPEGTVYAEPGFFFDATAPEFLVGEWIFLPASPGAVGMTEQDREALKRFENLPRKSFGEDGLARPQIKNGRFVQNGATSFIVGGMVWPTLHDFRHDRRWVTGDHALMGWDQTGSDYLAAGFSSIEPVTTTRPAARALGMTNVSWWESDLDEWVPFFQKMGPLPLWADFSAIGLSFRFSVEMAKKSALFPTNAFFKSAHPFSGFNIFSPVGRKLYEAHFLTGVHAYLSNGMNPYVYELWNEPGIQERSELLGAEFTAYLKNRYTNVERANAVWGASHTSLESAALNASKSQDKGGPFVDYLEFMGDAVTDFLADMKRLVQSVDKRKDVAFAVQPHIAAMANIGIEVIDMYKVAKVMDVVTTEGGVRFGSEGEGTGEAKDLLNAVYSSSGYQDLFQFDVFRSLANDFNKPLMDAEFYTSRRYGNHKTRVPSRVEDLVTAYWEMAMHDYDGVYNYSLEKNAMSWSTYAEAFTEATSAGYKVNMWLNPANVGFETVTNGNLTFQREFKLLSHFLGPKPRSKPRVALLFSTPSRRILGVWKNGYHNSDYTRRMVAAYTALMNAHYEIKIVFEEQLRDKGIPVLDGIEAVVAPVNVYSFRETLPVLESYLQKGGLLIAGSDAFEKDAYGVPFANPLLERKKNGDSDKAVFYSKSTEAGAAESGILPSLEKRGVSRTALIRPKAAGQSLKVEAHKIISGKETLYYFLNHATTPVLVNVNPLSTEGGVLCEVPTRTWYPSPAGGRFWSAADLSGRGVDLVLPSQKRMIFVLANDEKSLDAYGIVHTAKQEEMAGRLSRETAEEEKRVAAEKSMIPTRVTNQHGNFPANPGREFQIDLSRVANASHRDPVDGAPRFQTFLNRPQIFNAVMFEVPAPEKNSGKNILMLGGARSGSVSIPVGRKAKQLFFLHALSGENPGEDGGTYRIHYENGTSANVALRPGETIGPARLGAPAGKDPKVWLTESLRLAWVGRHLGVYDQALYNYRWANPAPEEEIRSVEVVPGGETLVLFALTAE